MKTNFLHSTLSAIVVSGSLVLPNAAMATESDLIDDWQTMSNPAGRWSFEWANGKHAAPTALLTPTSTGFELGYARVQRLKNGTDNFITVATSWSNIPWIVWTAPSAGTATISATLFNIGGSDIHWQVLVNGGARSVLPPFVEYSVLGSSATSPISFSFSEGNQLAAGDRIAMWFYPENCCGDVMGLKLHVSFSPVVAVPEPGVYGLLIAGLGLLGVLRQLRRRQSVAKAISSATTA